MMNMAPIFLRNSLQLGTHANSARAEMMTGCKLTLSQERHGEGQRQTPKPERKSHDQHNQHELYRHQHVQEMWQNWTLGDRLLQTPATTATRRKARVTRKAQGKANMWTLWKRISLLQQLLSCRIVTNTEYNWRTLVQFKRGSVDYGCENQFRVYKETSWCRVFAS